MSAAWPKKSGQIKTQFSLIYTAFSHLKVSNIQYKDREYTYTFYFVVLVIISARKVS